MSILAVGSIAFDSIATPSGRVENVLGGSCTFFSLAASYFTEVRIVAVVGEDFTVPLLTFASCFGPSSVAPATT